MAEVSSKEDFYKHLDKEVKDYDSKKEIHNMDERPSKTDHAHNFRISAGNSAQCDCGWGIYLSADDEIKDGHLYVKGELII